MSLQRLDNLLPVSMTPAINCRRFRCHGIDENQGQSIITGIKDHRRLPDTSEQLFASVVTEY
jgi:hypothetical protein